MHREELMERAAARDEEAFRSWKVEERQRVARFGYQNGLSSELAARYAETVFERVWLRLTEGPPRNLMTLLYAEAAAQIIKEPACPTEDEEIRFEEDRELHRAMLSLEQEERLPLVLVQLHALTDREAAEALLIKPSDVQSRIEAGIKRLTSKLGLTGRLIERRLDLLKLSYARLPFSFSEEREEKTESEVEPVEPNLTSVQTVAVGRKSAMATAAAAVLMAGIIGLSFAFNESGEEQETAARTENEDTLTEAKIEAWRTQYENVRVEGAETLGMEVEDFNQFNFVREADAAFAEMLDDSTLDSLDNSPEEADRLYRQVLHQIQLPGEMVDSVWLNPLREQETRVFLEEFAEKTAELRYRAEAILMKYQDELANFEFDGELSTRMLMAKRSEIPAEVEQLVDSLSDQGLILQMHPNEARFMVRRDMAELMNSNGLSLSEDNHFYLWILQQAPYYDETGLLYSAEELQYMLMTMGQALVVADENSELYQQTQTMFSVSFWMLLHGTDTQLVFNEDGEIKTEIRQALQGLLHHSSVNPIIYILLPIVEEMEASGWTSSESYERMEFEDILTAIELEREGQLAALLPGGDMEVGNERLSLDREEELFSRVSDLYGTFAKDHNDNHLKGVTAVDVFLLYEYASKQGDAETMWHLLAEEPLKPDLDEYIVSWEQPAPLAERYGWVEFNENQKRREGRIVFTEAYAEVLTDEAAMMYQPGPILQTTDANVWKVKYQLVENVELTEETQAQEYWTKARSLYDRYAEQRDSDLLIELSPLEVVGLYLVAQESKDYNIMHGLLADLYNSKPPLDQLAEIEESRLNYRPKSEMGMLGFFSRSYTGDRLPRGEVIINYTTGGEAIEWNSMSMVKKDGYWQIMYPY